jgi:2-polyprenyl-3-methyl-5-hydroxy-6-metoxy-1,4-benzoquinol methylase
VTGVDATGRYAWPAGRRLTRDLAEVVDCDGRAICDLGCGLGALGHAALRLGAARVDFLDGSEEALAGAIIGLEHEPRAACHRHQWGEPMPRRYDLILGGDILYRAELFAALLDSIASGLAPGGLCLLSDPREHLEEELPRLAAERSLSWTTERRSDFTLARLQTAAAAPTG